MHKYIYTYIDNYLICISIYIERENFTAKKDSAHIAQAIAKVDKEYK